MLQLKMSEAKSGKRIDNCFYCVCGGLIIMRSINHHPNIRSMDNPPNMRSIDHQPNKRSMALFISPEFCCGALMLGET